MNVLVTGGDGLLGRELCLQLRQHHVVHSVVHQPVHSPLQGVQYLVVNLSERVRLEALPEKIDVVVHLAQSSEFRNFPGGARDTFSVNTSSTLDLLEYCRIAGGKKFVLASTGGVYEGHDAPIPEAGALIPPSRIGFYFASKLAAEMLASTYRQLFDVTVLRFFFMFGPRQRPDMFLPRLIHRVLDGEAIQVDSRGGIRVNPIGVNDAAALVGEILHRTSPPVLNVAGKEVVSIQDIADAIGDLAGRKATFEVGSSARDIVADISAMLEFLPQNRLTPFHVSLQEMVSHVLAERGD